MKRRPLPLLSDTELTRVRFQAGDQVVVRVNAKPGGGIVPAGGGRIAVVQACRYVLSPEDAVAITVYREATGPERQQFERHVQQWASPAPVTIQYLPKQPLPHPVLSKGDRLKMRRSVDAWAGVDVRLLLVDETQMAVEVIKKPPAVAEGFAACAQP